MKINESAVVSLIIPVYNVEDYLDECIESAVQQTYENLEIILVDDGSTDKSGRICDEWSAKDDRVKVIHHKNKGASAARNKGLKMATGKYVQFVDADDVIDSQMVEKMFVECEEQGADIACCRYDAFSESLSDVFYQEPKVYIKSNNVNQIADQVFNITTTSVCNKMFRKALLQENKLMFNEKLVRGEDLLFTHQALSLAKKVCVVNEFLYHYRASVATSTMHQVDPESQTTFRALQLLKNFLNENVLYDKFKESFIKRVFDTILFDYAGHDKLFIECYSDIRAFVLNLDEDMKKPRSDFVGANSGRWSYNDVMRIIKNEQPIDYYVRKAKEQTKTIAEQQEYIDRLSKINNDLKNEANQLRSPGIKASTKQLLRSIKNRINRQ
ncbi:glycosyltransferase [Candidatus Saccharibacteria bacterium]|nr:glycosyltransferase [Candidatus Saccharibacteria bacterium]